MNARAACVSGSLLRVWLPQRSVFHYGFLNVEWPGAVSVMHNSKDRGGVVVTSFDEFAQGQQVEIVWVPEYWQTAAVMARAKSQICKRPFNLLNWNCEDFVSWVLQGVPRSPQRDALALAGAALAVLTVAVCIVTAKAVRG